MKPPAFQYVRPQTLADALSALANEPDAKVLAGGQSLIPMMNMRLARPGTLVDVNGLEQLARIDAAQDSLLVGALVRHYQLAASPLIREYSPMVAQAEKLIAHEAIRSRGTLGGSLAHADPAAELPVLAILLDWNLVVQSAAATREIPAREFFVSYFITALGPDEMVTAVSMPKEKSVGHITEYAIRSGDFALAIAAASVEQDGAGTISRLRLALGGVGDVPWRDDTFESQWVGEPVHDDLWQEVGRAAVEQISPADDLHATADYRRHLAQNLAAEALRQAAANGRT
jgi:CO/xanthine dehydrogenase FAD-binding subunit